MFEIETFDRLRAHLDHHDSWRGVIVQGLDLTDWTDELCRESVGGAVFLGCVMSPRSLAHVFAQGALIFPRLPQVPFDPYLGHLYRVEELYEGFDRHNPASYAQTLDARVYQHWQEQGRDDPDSILETLARRLHDHSVTNAMRDMLLGKNKGGKEHRVIAIMGGHSLSRADAAYRDVAIIARALTREGFLMASGGGPGAMEATHLGAWLAAHPDEALDASLKLLADAPSYKDERWLAAAFDVRARFPVTKAQQERFPSLGIPTWLYGHEPPNAFATHVAKYFANSVREDGLLAIAKAGVVFAPGSAGTIQEIFQDACQNHYKTVGVVSPMVFLNRNYWTQIKPVYPLLAQLAAGQEYAQYLSIHDKPEDILTELRRYDEASG